MFLFSDTPVFCGPAPNFPQLTKMELINGSSTSITRYINFTICGNPLPEISMRLEDTPVHTTTSVTASQKYAIHVVAMMADIGAKDCGKRLSVDMEKIFTNTYELVVACEFFIFVRHFVYFADFVYPSNADPFFHKNNFL